MPAGLCSCRQSRAPTAIDAPCPHLSSALPGRGTHASTAALSPPAICRQVATLLQVALGLLLPTLALAQTECRALARFRREHPVARQGGSWGGGAPGASAGGQQRLGSSSRAGSGGSRKAGGWQAHCTELYVALLAWLHPRLRGFPAPHHGLQLLAAVGVLWLAICSLVRW